MKIYSKSGLALTAQFEGCSLVAYRDLGGIWTIGHGHTTNVDAGDTCTQSQAEQWLIDDTKAASDAVNNLVKINLTQGEHDALTDFVFNVGIGAFSRSTMLKLLNDNHLPEAADQFHRWDMVSGRHVAGLLRRREAEEKEFMS